MLNHAQGNYTVPSVLMTLVTLLNIVIFVDSNIFWTFCHNKFECHSDMRWQLAELYWNCHLQNEVHLAMGRTNTQTSHSLELTYNLLIFMRTAVRQNLEHFFIIVIFTVSLFYRNISQVSVQFLQCLVIDNANMHKVCCLELFPFRLLPIIPSSWKKMYGHIKPRSH